MADQPGTSQRRASPFDSNELHKIFQEALLRVRDFAPLPSEVLELADYVPDPDPERLAHLISKNANGDSLLAGHTVKVKVEYLRSDQRLVIPYGLAHGFSPSEPTEVRYNQVMLLRYCKIAKLGFHECARFVEESTPAAKIREIVDSVTLEEEAFIPAAQLQAYSTPEWYTVNGIPEVNRQRIHIVMTYVSCACQMNFDVRDLGSLNGPDMRISDDAWQQAQDYSADRARDRLRNKLQQYTLASIAALNYSRVDNVAIAAWVRAYGVGCGILHDRASQSVVEYDFTTKHPDREHRRMCNAVELDSQNNLYTLCLNIISMFGLFHLNTEHTFRTSDSNVDPALYANTRRTKRIAISYVNTLRTMTTESLVGHLETIVYTAAHPLGLAQTYWCAQVMHRLKGLASPLMLRCNTTPTPPLIQRLMAVLSAVDEWANLPVGLAINEALADSIEQLRVEVARIKAKPPAFSELWRIYGLQAMSEVSQGVLLIVDKLMPLVLGFAIAQHVNDGKRDGIALELNLDDVERKHHDGARKFGSMWDRYLTLHAGGLVETAGNVEAGGLVEMASLLVAGLGTTPAK